MQLINISKTYGKHTVLDNINFTMDSKITGLIGKNGAGKTTMMKIMCKVIQNYTGELKHKSNNDVAYLIEEPKYFKNKSGRHNIEYFTKIYTHDYDETYVNELLDTLGMNDYINQKMRTYSMGMKQKTGLMIALARKPKFLILDEPTNGMDPDGSIEVLKIIKDISNRYDIHVFISSHKLEDIEAVSDDIIFIHDGKLSDKESVSELSTNVKLSFVFSEADIETARQILKQFDATSEITGNIISTQHAHALQDILKALSLKGIFPEDINKHKTSVKDYYFNQMGEVTHENH